MMSCQLLPMLLLAVGAASPASTSDAPLKLEGLKLRVTAPVGATSRWDPVLGAETVSLGEKPCAVLWNASEKTPQTLDAAKKARLAKHPLDAKATATLLASSRREDGYELTYRTVLFGETMHHFFLYRRLDGHAVVCEVNTPDPAVLPLAQRICGTVSAAERADGK